MRLTIACEGAPILTCDWQEFRRDNAAAFDQGALDKMLVRLAKGQAVRLGGGAAPEIEVRAA